MRTLVRRPYARPAETGVTTSPAHRVSAVAARASVLLLGLVWLLVALASVPVLAQPPTTNVEDPRPYEVAAQLRCVVCQNLSVADSPSEMAQQMRVIIRERLAAGESPAQITQYFVEKYGEWILLSPRRSGFNLLVWGFPIAAIAVGLIVLAWVLRRWTSRARGDDAVSRGRRDERVDAPRRGVRSMKGGVPHAPALTPCRHPRGDDDQRGANARFQQEEELT